MVFVVCDLFFLLVRLLVLHSLSNHMDEQNWPRKTVTKGRYFVLKPVICIRGLEAEIRRYSLGGREGAREVECGECLGGVFVKRQH